LNTPIEGRERGSDQRTDRHDFHQATGAISKQGERYTGDFVNGHEAILMGVKQPTVQPRHYPGFSVSW